VTAQRRGLGRGLGALIPTAPPEAALREGADGSPSRPTAPQPRAGEASGGGGTDAQGTEIQPVAGAYFAELPTTAIVPNTRQPRQHFDQEALEELATSISVVGLLQPIVVRRIPSVLEESGQRYELVMGERRWRASQHAGVDTIPAIVRETSDDEMLRDALMENLHRQQLNPLEEAAAYQQLLDDFGVTHEELAVRIGRSRPHISNTLRLLNLPPGVQRRVAAGVLSAGHARALLGLDTAEAQEHVALRIVQEGLSVRAVEEIIALGDEATDNPARRKHGKKPVAPALRDIADRLSDLYETKVHVDLGKRKGKIVVEFGSLEDLERIIEAMTPEGTSISRRAASGS
jgi:ParB family chromosome partitioning protein